MTNTLTGDIKRIALPKINANLLSVISLILLLTMAFFIIAVIAEICEEEDAAAEAAEVEAYAALEDLKVAGNRLIAASILYTAALATKIPYLIKRAGDHYRGCFIRYCVARNAAKEANAKYREAVERFKECVDSHGADSGSNSSGNNNT